MSYSLIKINNDDVNQAERIIETFISNRANRPNVETIEPNSTVLYVGDLHGSYNTLIKVIELANEHKVDYIVFLGDYTDRGEQELETILNVLNLSNSNDKVIVLRGNHEEAEINRNYNFYRTIIDAHSEYTGNNLFSLFTKAYDYMGLASLNLGTRTLGIHGGIPTEEDIETINMIPKPHSNLINNSEDQIRKLFKIFYEIRWNDPLTYHDITRNPLDTEDEEYDQVKGFFPSARGFNISTFTEKALDNFCRVNNIHRIIRSHEATRGNYQKLWKGKLLHIFSAAPYNHNIHEGAFIMERHDEKFNKVELDVITTNKQIIDKLRY